MSDFESLFRQRVKRALEMNGVEKFADRIPEDDQSIDYTLALMNFLNSCSCGAAVMEACACHYDHCSLVEIKQIYDDTGDIALAYRALLHMFKGMIKQYKKLTDAQVRDIVSRGWGMAGLLEDGVITATKIPSRFQEYFAETDPDKKAQFYCHCPRIRPALEQGVQIDPLYCNCGMGFYTDLWEYILGRKVRGEVVQTILAGDDVCMFRIYLQD